MEIPWFPFSCSEVKHWLAVKQGSENPSVEKIWDNSVALVLWWTDGWKSDGEGGTDWEGPIGVLKNLGRKAGNVLLEDYMFSFGDLYFQDEQYDEPGFSRCVSSSMC